LVVFGDSEPDLEPADELNIAHPRINFPY